MLCFTKILLLMQMLTKRFQNLLQAAVNCFPGTANSRLLSVACLCLLLAPGIEVFASAPYSDSAVGEVTFMLGKKAWITRSGAAPDLLQPGAKVGVQDIIETGAGTFVHVGFVDNAKVVVRSSSRLAIERYDYSSLNPEDSVVKFNLQEGVFRAISGNAAKKAKDNFRLNTPIAAIGVRGTDFVVRASESTVRAQVREGAIVIAPFSSECTAAAFGPCSLNSMELNGESRDIVELTPNAPRPQLLQIAKNSLSNELADSSEPVALAEVETTPDVEAQDESTKNINTAETVTTLAVSSKIIDSEQASTPNVDIPVVEPPVPVREFTPATLLSAEELTSRQLVWGRWGDSVAAGDRILVGYNTAFSDGRVTTVGNDFYALYRDAEITNTLKPGLGDLSFELDLAQASYRTDAGSEAMNVYGGELNINFDTRRFNTSLELFHPDLGDVIYSDNGITFDNGRFLQSSSELKKTAGYVSLDGSEAAYFFEQILDAGTIEGVTLWNGQP